MRDQQDQGGGGHQGRGDQDRGGRLLPLAAFAVILALLAGGFLLFPHLQRAIGFQDCVATGRTDC